MKFSIVTPSFCQLELLRLCIASVRDQVVEEETVDSSLLIDGSPEESEINNNQSTISRLRVEHIIQDGGTPGIEEFAREVGAAFYRDGEKIFDSSLMIAGSRNEEAPRNEKRENGLSTPNYTCRVFCEADSGMYDAINHGFRQSPGDVYAWLNCDEQYLPATLKRVAGFLENSPSIDVVVGDTILLDENLQPKAYRKAVTPQRRYLQAFQMNLHSSSLFFRRDILDRGLWLGSRFRSIGDAEWVGRLLDSKVRFAMLDRPLSTFVLGSQNLSGNALSEKEAGIWRAELSLSRMEKALLKLRNGVARFAHGAYLPRKCAVQIYTYGDLDARTYLPKRWLDFRFRT